MNPQTKQQQTWHHLTEAELLTLLATSRETGLDSSEVVLRQQKFGRNLITPSKGQSPLILFLLQFHQPLIYILLAAAVITSFLQEWVDAGVIYGVVLVNAIIGFIQEDKAVKAIEALSQALTGSATVVRGGLRQQIPAEDLAPGDLVLLQPGDKVPADLRLVSTRELQIAEAPLTGESLAVHKTNEALPLETLLADRCNMAYSSTLVISGVGSGVVVATGDLTEIGRINQLIAKADILSTPLTRKISRFSSLLLYIILALSALTFVVGVLRGASMFDMFMAVVALAVGAIPEGLPAAVTITLAIGVGKMARRNTIIRKLPAVETLGSTTIICSDKTGTLTQNQMTVQEIHTGGDLILLSGNGYGPEGSFSRNGLLLDPSEHPALRECLMAGMLCNDAVVRKAGDEWQVEGDPTEAALLTAARKADLDDETIRSRFPRLDVIPFESEYQYMATLHEDDSCQTIYLKGALESLLPRCSQELSASGTTLPLDGEQWNRRGEAMAAKGLRVLAFARLQRSVGRNELDHGDLTASLTLLGLQGMIDPPRNEAVRAIAVCRKAGIQVKMITGDHVITAAAIARQIGLQGAGSDVDQTPALNGRELELLSDRELIEAVGRTAVFARVAPEQKLRLVEALQARGEVVAMTGDGVNDAPALRQADIGVAMGIGGTEVAKEAADMVLTDDNFSSIEAAVEEGRGVYDNLVKFITWTLPTNLGEGLVILAAVLAGVQLPILPVQILWINMTTAVLLGLMLAFEPKEPGIMERAPIDPQKPLLTLELTIRIVIVGVLLLAVSFGLFQWQLSLGNNLAVARSCAVNAFVFGELFYLFNCRSLHTSLRKIGLFSNVWLLWGVGIMIALQLLFTYLPVMNRAFGSRPIGVSAWGVILAASFAIYLVIEIEKRLWRR